MNLRKTRKGGKKKNKRKKTARGLKRKFSSLYDQAKYEDPNYIEYILVEKEDFESITESMSEVVKRKLELRLEKLELEQNSKVNEYSDFWHFIQNHGNNPRKFEIKQNNQKFLYATVRHIAPPNNHNRLQITIIEDIDKYEKSEQRKALGYHD